MKTASPLVSIIMTVYNGLPYLKNSIDSVLNQSYDNFEFIVVDDGSTDKSCSFIEKNYDTNKIKLIRNEKVGRAKALNLGINISRGEFISIIDSDDIFLEDKIRLQVEFFKKNPEYSLVGSMSNLYNYDTKSLVDNSINRPIEHDDIVKYFLIGQPIQHPTVLIRKEVVKNIGGYNENIKFLLDRDIFLRILKKGGRLYNINKCLVHVGHHENRFFYHTYTGKERVKLDFHYRFYAADIIGKSILFKLKLWFLFRWSLLPNSIRNILKFKFKNEK